MPRPFIGRRERLRRQASDWMARLSGPHDEYDREAFDRWYGANPEHAVAFDRISNVFETAGKIRPSAAGPTVEGGPQGSAIRYAVAAAAVACVVVLVFWFLAPHRIVSSEVPASQSAVFASSADDSRQIVLVDGSEVILSPGSELKIAIGDEARRLFLLRGEARFSVLHDSRPFVVTANDTEIIARGTEFVVSLGREGTLVSLIEGRVEVSQPPASDQPRRQVTRLAPGERVMIPARVAASATPVPVLYRSWREGMIAFDDTPLAEAIEQVNRQAAKRIRLDEAKLEGMRVTGTYRAGDAEGFAESVAVALQLELRRGDDGSLWLQSPHGGSGKR